MANDNTFLDLARLNQAIQGINEGLSEGTFNADKFMKKFQDYKELQPFLDVLKNIDESVSDSSKALELLRSEFANMDIGIKNSIDEYITLNETINKGSKEFKDIADKMRELNSTVDDDKLVSFMQNAKAKLTAFKEEAAKTVKSLQEIGDLSLTASTSFDKMGKALGLANKMSDYNNGFFAKVTNLINSGNAKEFTLFMSSMKTSFSDIVNPLSISLNYFGKYISTIKMMVFELDNANSSLNKSMATLNEYTSVISDAQKYGAEFGLTYSENADIIKNTSTYFNDFNKMTEENKTTMVGLIGLYSKFGTSSALMTKVIGKLTDTFADNGDTARTYMKHIMTLNDTLGKQLSETVSDLDASFGRLSRFGPKQALEVFKSLQTQSKSLGVQMNSLLSITEKFDSYDQAAQSVGRFNAIFGGPFLNTIQLMRSTDSERLEIIKNQVDMMGIQYEALNHQEQQVLASAVGITDMADAQKFFTKSIYDYRSEKNKQIQSEEESKKIAIESQAVMEKLKSTFISLVDGIEPLLSAFRAVTDVISWVLKGFDGLVGKVLIWGGVIVFAIKKMSSFYSLLKKEGGVLLWLKGLIVSKTAATVGSSAADTASIAPKIAVSLAEDKDTASKVLNNTVTKVGIATKIGSAAASGAAATAMGIQAVASGVLGAATGILGGVLRGFSVILTSIAGGIVSMTTALAGAAPIIFIGSLALGAFGIALGLLVGNVWLLGQGLVSMGEGFASIFDAFDSDARAQNRLLKLTQIDKSAALHWDSIARAITNVSNSISNGNFDNIDKLKGLSDVKVTMSTDMYTNFFESIASVSTTSADSLNKTKQIVEQISHISSSGDSTNLKAATEMIKSLNVGSASKQSEQSSQPIIIKIDDLVLGKWMDNRQDRSIRQPTSLSMST